ncbi:MAG: choice-of-anchor D domain-containing protein [Bryobacteraceae bacterium]
MQVLEGVYPGVDVAFYGNASRLEYDFLLQPGADARRIRMALGGADQVTANESGDLVLRLGNGDIRLLKPVAWQTSKDGKRRENVEAGYRLERTASGEPAMVSLALGRYDHARPLVIDPAVSGEALIYSEYLTDLSVASVAADNSGNTYVTGYTPSLNGFYVTKFNSSGAVVYTTIIGTGQLYPYQIALDGSGRAYVVGQINYAYAATLPTGANSYQSGATAYFSGFYLQIASNGASVPYATFLGGTDTNGTAAQGLAVDSSGNSYIAGETDSATFPVTTGVYQNAFLGTPGGNSEGFVTKINPAASGSASLVYSTYLGPLGTDIFALAIDGSGDAYVTGTGPNGFPVTAGAFQYTGYESGSGGVYVTKLNPTGAALVYSAYLGYGTANGIAVDGSGDAYVTGTVGYDDFPTTAGAYQTSYAGAFVTELAANGASEVYSTFLGGPSSFTGNNVVPEAIALQNGCTSSCNAYISGWTSTSDFPTINAIQTTPSSSGQSGFLVELASGGSSALFSSYLSGLIGGVSEGVSGDGPTPSLAVDSSGNMSVVGNVSGSDFPVTISNGNTGPGFLAKIGPSGVPYIWGVPSFIAFGSQPVGVSTSINNGTATVELRNISSTAATLSSIQASPPSIFFESDNCSGSIPAGGSCTLDVDFTPGGPGARSGTLTVTSNASDSPMVITLTGTGEDTPFIQASPLSLTFANQNVGSASTPQSVTLTNIGDETASLSIYTYNNYYYGLTDFSELNNCPSQLPPGNSCLVNVTFDPTQAGLRTDTLYLAGAGPTTTVPLSGSGTVSGSSAQLSFSATSLNLGNEPIGVTSAYESVTVTNNGSVAIVVQSLTVSGDFSLYTATCGAPPFQLNPQSSCYVEVNFTPSATGSRTGNLTLVDSASGSPQTVALNGTGLASVQTLEFYPFTADAFPDTPVGVASGEQLVYAYNAGTDPVSIDRMLVSGDFQITNTSCPESTLAGTLYDGSSSAGITSYAYCYVYVTFTPTATGARTGTLTFTDTATGSPQVVNLAGNGITATGAAVLTPTQLVFPAQAVGTTSSVQYVEIANPGNSTVTINSWGTGASDFAVASSYTCGTPPLSLTAGSNCQIQISFTPTVGSASPGTARTGTLTVSSSAGTATTGLTGAGLTATQAIGLTPTSINFGSVGTGQTTGYYTYPVYLRDTGTEPVSFTDDGVLTGTNASDFVVNNYTCPGAGGQLQPGTSCYMFVQFTPGAAGSRTATLTFHNSAGSQAMTLSGTGVSTLPISTAVPTEQPFDLQVQGTTSTGSYVYFYNNGASSVTLGNIALTGDFLVTSGNQNCNGQVISPGGNCFAYVSFAPTAAGYRTGTLAFKNSSNSTLISVPLAGYALAPVNTAYLDPSAVAFPVDQVVGTTTTTGQYVYLYNSGNLPLTLGTLTGTNLGASPTDEFSITGTDYCSGQTVAAGSSCYVYAVFTPNAAGARSGTIVFPVTYTGGATQNFTANLTGTGVAEKNSAVLSPTAASFLDQAVGTTSPSVTTFTLTNSGNLPFTVGAISGTNLIGGASGTGEFSASVTTGGYDGCSGTSVAVGSYCYVNLTFTPSAAGARSGSIAFPVTFADTTTAKPSATLAGKGIASTATLQISPAAVQFPVQITGTTSANAQTVTIFNTGNVPVHFATDTITGNFQITSDGCSTTNLTVGSLCDITVTFTPTTTGARTGTLTVADNATGGPHSVSLSGTGIPATQQVALSQTTVAFGNQPAGSSSSPQAVYVTDQADTAVGTFTAALGGTNAADFQLTNNCPGSLSPRTTCTLAIAFAPQVSATGARTASIAITTSVAGETSLTVNLTGTAVVPGPAASLHPPSLTFAQQNVGTTSAAQQMSVTNTGSVSLTITGVASTNATEFPLSLDGCSGNTLTPAQFCTVSVKFLPSLGGTRSTTIKVTDNATGSPQSLSVTGTGYGIPVAALSPATVPFGSSNIGVATASQNVTLTNTGTDVLDIASVALTGANPGDYNISSNGCGATLSATVSAPHPSCVIAVTFTPTAAGSRGAALTVTDNAGNLAGSTQSTALTGTGVPVPNAGLSTGTLPSFGSVNIGTTSTAQTVTVSNTGTGPLTIASIVVGGTNPGDFGQTNNCGATLNNGSTCTISVTFTPTASGARSATITLTDNAGNVAGATQVVNASGTGVAVPQGATTAPSNLIFANQNVNSTSAAQVVTLTNTGTGALTIASIAITGTNAGDFGKTTTCGATLAGSGGTCTISVTFTPTALGSRTATLVITDNAGNVTGSTQQVTLNGTGVGVPVAGVSTSSIPFGNQNLGTTSASQPVTLNNTTGTGPLTISSISIGGTNPGDFGQTNNCGTSVAIGGSCTINVTFAPTAAGSRSGTLIVSDNSNNAASSQTVNLTGTGVAVPNAGLSTSTLPSFGSVNIGTTSAAQTVTVSNTGTGPLTIASIVVGGTNPGDFGKTSDCGATLNNGASCTIVVIFTPTAAGARSATITLTDNANNVTGATQVISASGTGVALPGVTAAPSSLTYTDQNINTTSGAQVVTLTNNGTGALTIASIAIGGTNSGDFGKTTTCGASLAGSGGSCTISVTFTPTASGSRTATLVITDNAGNVTGSTQQVTLSGTGVAVPVAGVSTSSIPFGSQNLGTTSASQPVTLNNTTGTGPLTISSISIGGTNPGDFGQTNNCGASVAAGGSCTINVTFAPLAAGSRSGTLIISDNSNNTASSQTVSLTGTGVAVAIGSPSTGTLPSFGSEPVGVTSAAQSLTLTSTGTSGLTITSIAIGGTNPGDFAQTNNCPGTLVIGASCTISVTFTPAATGSRSGTLIITDNSGDVAGTQQDVGLTGTGTAAPGTPVPVSISPINGSGSTQTFTMTFLDDNGTADVKNLYVLFNTTSAMAYGCEVSYNQTLASNRIYLANDAGTGWLPSVGVSSSTPLANSQCTVTASGITSSGNELTLTLTITFAAGFSGQKNVYMEAIGASGNSGWMLEGTWTTAPRQTLTTGPISPINGTGLSQTFTLSYPDANGVSDIAKGLVLFSTSSSTSVNACYIEFYPSGALYLRNNAGTAWSAAVEAGSATPLSNSQCTLTGSSLALAPGGLTLGLSLTFSGTFTGSRNVYMETEPVSGSATGFQLEGTWTP